MRAFTLVLLVLAHQALFAAAADPTPAAAVPRLFVPLPADEVAAASAPVLPEDVQVVTATSAGGRVAPNAMNTMINEELLLQADRPVLMDLPGMSRGVRVRWQPTATASSRMAAAPSDAARVGEVQGLPGPLSFVGMVAVGDNKTVYGDIRFYDRVTRSVRSYRVMPAGSTASGNITYTVVEYKEPNRPRHFAVPQHQAGPAAAAAHGADPAAPTGDAITTEAAAAAPDASVAVPDAAAADAGTGQRRRLQQAAPIVQELLIAYTPAAASAAGGDAAIRSQAQLAVMRTNKAYTDSGVNVQVALLDVRRFDYNERQFRTGNEVFNNLAKRGGAANGQASMHPTLAAWRNELGADLVSVFTVAYSDACGVGWWPTDWNWDNNEYGFSTVHGCWPGYTLAHEMGHNQGCGHNFDDSAANGGGQGFFYGWRRCDQGSSNFKTILSYSCLQGSTAREIGAFSTPTRQISINGRKMIIGDAQRGNCARAISESAARVAAFRPTRNGGGGGGGGDTTSYTCVPEQDARGTDIQSLHNVDENACRDACSRNSACTFYVYMKSRSCYLKRDFNNGPHGVTGPNSNVANLCQKPGTVSYTCVPEQDARGTDIQSLQNVDENACRDACSRNSACTFYVYMKSRSCYLKRDFNNGPHGVTGSNSNVANLCQKPGASGPSYRCVSGQDARGTDIRGFGVASENDCRAACTSEPACSFYVLLNRSAAWNNQFPCFLKRDKNNGPHGTTGPNSNVVSLCDKIGSASSG